MVGDLKTKAKMNGMYGKVKKSDDVSHGLGERSTKTLSHQHWKCKKPLTAFKSRLADSGKIVYFP